MAFINNQNIVSVKIPDSVRTIGFSFTGCNNLRYADLPDTLVSLGESFYNCNENLYEICNDTLYYINDYCISGVNDQITSAILKDGTTLISKGFTDYENLEEIYIPDTVTMIPYNCFSNCSSLVNVRLSENLTELPSYCFRNCTSLTGITLPESIIAIGTYTFIGCTGLISITLPDKIFCFLGYNFLNCTALETVHLPRNINSIANNTFLNCSSLETITLPDKLEYINSGAFKNSALTTLTILNQNPPNIHDDIFSDTNITNIYVHQNSVSAYQSADKWSAYSSKISAIDPAPLTLSLVNEDDQCGTISGAGAYLAGNSAKIIATANSGYSFAGWYDSNSNLLSQDTRYSFTINSDTALTAKWLPADYTVTFDSSGGSAVNSITQAYGSNISAPSPSPAKINYSFQGWYTIDGTEYIFDTMPNEDITLYARWNIAYTEQLEFTLINNGSEYEVSSISDNTIVNVIIPSVYNNLPVTSIGCDALSSTDAQSVVLPDSIIIINQRAFAHCHDLVNINIPDSVIDLDSNIFMDCDSINYEIYNNLKYLDNWLMSAENTNIPAVQMKDTTIGIYDLAFMSCSSITEVVIPDTVRTIGSGAFTFCSNLQKAEVGGNVQTIKDYAFYYDPKLTTVVFKNTTLSYVGATIFYGSPLEEIFVPDESLAHYKSKENLQEYKDIIFSDGPFQFAEINGGTEYALTKINKIAAGTDITIPSTYNGKPVTAIKDSVFNKMSDIASIELPDSITSIGESAFAYAKNLTSITLPSGLTSIGSSAFAYCSNLSAITIPNGVTAIPDFAFANCESLASVTLHSAITSIGKYAFYKSPLTSISIPNVTVIDDYAFSETLLTQIIIPDSVEKIGDYAFAKCLQATLISIGSGVTEIGDYAFIEDNPTQFVQNSTILTYIGDYAFSSTGLTEFDIPASVTYLGEGAFSGCKFTSVTIPQSIKELKARVFYYSALQTAYLNNVEEIGDEAFYKCADLTFVQAPHLITIGNSAFNNCGEFDGSGLSMSNVTKIGDKAFNYCTSITTIDLGNKLQIIGEATFTYCKELTSIIIPDTVTEIGDKAFNNCKKLAEVKLSQSLTSIGEKAFYNCPLLTKITVPENVTYIGDQAFAWGKTLTRMYMSPITPCSVGAEILKGYNKALKIFVDYTAEPTYKSASGWSQYRDIIFADSPLIFEYDSVSDSYEVVGYNAEFIEEGSELVIPSEYDGKPVTDIDGLFGCKMGSVVIPDTVINICEKAFSNCYNIKNVIIPDSVTFIGTSAFQGCSSLESIKLSENLTKLDNTVFCDCSSLKHLTIHSKIEFIGLELFYECNSLEDITIEATTPPRIWEHLCFGLLNNFKTIYVPQGTLDAYEQKWQKEASSSYFYRYLEELP